MKPNLQNLEGTFTFNFRFNILQKLQNCVKNRSRGLWLDLQSLKHLDQQLSSCFKNGTNQYQISTTSVRSQTA